MEELLKDLGSVRWWGGVVISGMLINLASTYIKPIIDRTFLRLSEKGKNKLKSMREADAAYLERLRTDKDFLFLEALEELRDRSRSTHMLLMGSFILAAASIFPLPFPARAFSLGCAGACFFMSYLLFESASRAASKIKKSRHSVSS